MNAEFNWWLLIVGLVVGAGLVWLVLADSRRTDSEVGDAELADEAVWLAGAMTDDGTSMDAGTAHRMLLLHRAYLAATPPDDPAEFEPDEPELELDESGPEPDQPGPEPDPPPV